MLSSHPKIYIPPESNFFPRFFPYAPQEPLPKKKAVQLMEAVCSYKPFFKDWQGQKPDPVDFIDSLPGTDPVTILSELYSAYASQYGAQRWGDKTPFYVDHIEEIAAMFPSAQFIHIIRDGRDVALSMKRAYTKSRYFYMDTYYAARLWKRRLLEASRKGRLLGTQRYIEVRYEDLVSNPEPCIRSICDYLGEEYHPSMKDPHLTASKHHHSKGIHSSTRKPPSQVSIGRWRRDMPSSDQRLFQAVAGDLLAKNKYEVLELGQASAAEIVRRSLLKLKYHTLILGREIIQKSGVVHPTAFLTKWAKTNKKAEPKHSTEN